MTGQRDPLAGKIPVTLITGFLGSGKTTLISKLVRHPSMQRVAVVINEIGEIGIDHDLVTMSSENITLRRRRANNRKVTGYRSSCSSG